MQVDLVTFDEAFLRLSWEWLSDPEIKRLTGTPDFTPEEQVKWFETLGTRRDYLIWGIMVDGSRVGACGLKKIRGRECEYWGYIGVKSYWSKGIGKKVLKLAEDEAGQRKIEDIFLNVLKDNERALRLYRSSGYGVAGQNGELLRMKKHI